MAKTLFEQENYYVTNEGTKSEPSYHVWIPDITHSKCDSAYLELELAICRCKKAFYHEKLELRFKKTKSTSG
jgi:hypothetical protein